MDDNLDDSERSKRQRTLGESHSQDASEDRDCYDKVLVGEWDDIPGAQFSWLTPWQWMAHEVMEDVISEHSMDEDEDVTSEIDHLSKQLLQVKRRLRPAAERCADAAESNARDEFAEARRACNPMEVLGEGQQNGLNAMFMNRSAIKLANLDAALGFCLTTPPHETSTSLRMGTFTFVDLCAAPGGFSEYVLWRCLRSSRPCRGVGMSLHGSNEHGRGLHWKLQETVGNTCRYQICHGATGTGDIQEWDNILALQRMIRDHAEMTGNAPDPSGQESEWGRVHLVVADGGLDAQRDSENQEQVAQKLIVCEVAAALTLLQTNGSLVLKLFGFQTPVIRAVMRHLCLAFTNLIAVKPISSRPASAERYVVGVGFRGTPTGWDGRQWCNHMYLELPCPLTQRVAPKQDHDAMQGRLEQYLDEFDRDLGKLNLKACFSILSYLESKYMFLLQSNDCDQWDELRCDSPRVNIASFKVAWNLMGELQR